jgi:hypothetical protein
VPATIERPIQHRFSPSTFRLRTANPRTMPSPCAGSPTRHTETENEAQRPWSRWYDLPRWRRRAREQKRLHPLCKMCEAKGLITAAEVADHVSRTVAIISCSGMANCKACAGLATPREATGRAPRTPPTSAPMAGQPTNASGLDRIARGISHPNKVAGGGRRRSR